MRIQGNWLNLEKSLDSAWAILIRFILAIVSCILGNEYVTGFIFSECARYGSRRDKKTNNAEAIGDGV